MARRKDHTREELRELILAKAWDVVGREGGAALTARRVATEIGYTAGTLYNVFPSLDDLILAINGRTLDLMYDELQQPACHNLRKSIVQNLKAMASVYVDFATKYRPYWMMLFLSNLPADRYGETWYNEKTVRIFEPLESLLRTAYPQSDSDFVARHARIMWSSVHGICFLEQTGKFPSVALTQQLKETIHVFVEIYINGLPQES
jgi:AcrR family transcriptional regulator